MPKDNASEFTLEFFGILERRLAIQWTADGSPVFRPDEVNPISFQRLRKELADLYHSSALDAAVRDMEACPRNHKLIQSTGVGYSPDFDLFIRLGLLLGDRLVLWDTVFQSALSDPDHLIDKDDFGKHVGQLLLLKPVAERGGAVFLPHPIAWLDRARHYFKQVQQIGDVSADFLGFLNARSLLDEGIALHPYTLSGDRMHARSAKRAIIGECDLMQDDAVRFHEDLADLLQSEEFLLVRNASLDKFHSFLGDRPHRNELRKLLSNVPLGLSPQEQDAYATQTRKELRESIDAQNRDLLRQDIATAGAALGGIAATIALLHDAYSTAAFITLVTGTMSSMSRWFPVAQRFFTGSRIPTLYQVFHQLEETAEKQLLAEQSEKWRNLEDNTKRGVV